MSQTYQFVHFVNKTYLEARAKNSDPRKIPRKREKIPIFPVNSGSEQNCAGILKIFLNSISEVSIECFVPGILKSLPVDLFGHRRIREGTRGVCTPCVAK